MYLPEKSRLEENAQNKESKEKNNFYFEDINAYIFE
jgi:hypothetical protein